jgi:hypothetical protein
MELSHYCSCTLSDSRLLLWCFLRFVRFVVFSLVSFSWLGRSANSYSHNRKF